MKKYIQVSLLSFLGFASLFFAVPALAYNMHGGSGMFGFGRPIVAGTVSSVSGNTITINTSDNTHYSVDAGGATIHKGPTVTIQVSSVLIGDFVVVQGTINGTSVVATNILDGTFKHNGENGLGDKGDGNKNDGKPPFGHDGSKPNMEMIKMKRSFPGIVATIIGPNSFTIKARGIGHATTTLTVNTTASTSYNKVGTSSASFADLAPGLMVEIKGVLATSTRSITATVVHIGPFGPMNGGERREHGSSTSRGDDWKNGTTTPEHGFGATVFSFFRNFSHFFGR